MSGAEGGGAADGGRTEYVDPERLVAAVRAGAATTVARIDEIGVDERLIPGYFPSAGAAVRPNETFEQYSRRRQAERTVDIGLASAAAAAAAPAAAAPARTNFDSPEFNAARTLNIRELQTQRTAARRTTEQQAAKEALENIKKFRGPRGP